MAGECASLACRACRACRARRLTRSDPLPAVSHFVATARTALAPLHAKWWDCGPRGSGTFGPKRVVIAGLEARPTLTGRSGKFLGEVAGGEPGEDPLWIVQLDDPKLPKLKVPASNCLSRELPGWLPFTRDIEQRNLVTVLGMRLESFRRFEWRDVHGLGAGLRPDALELLDLVVDHAPWIQEMMGPDGGRPLTLVHHDARPDNVFVAVDAAPPSAVLIDWQFVGIGVGPAADLAWLVSGTLEPGFEDPVTGETVGPEAMRSTYRLIVEEYHDALVGAGVPDTYSLESCWRDFVLGVAWSSFAVFIIAGGGLDIPAKGTGAWPLLDKFVTRHANALVFLKEDLVPLLGQKW